MSFEFPNEEPELAEDTENEITGININEDI
jgi:hypothetical protein